MKAIRWLACVLALATLALATVGLLGLRSAAPVAAGATLVVDDDGQGSAADCDSSDSAYSTIVAAVGAAVSGDTVQVCPGTYTEIGQIVISTNLSMVGAGASTTIIKPAGDTGSSGDARGWFLVNDGITFDLSGVTLDGTGRNVYQGIRHKGAGTISDCVFSNIKYPGYMGVGMAVMGPSGMNVDVTDCTFTEMGRIGVIYFGAGVTGTFSGNTYTGKGDGDWLDYAVEVGGGANATITNNTISGDTGVASSDGSTSAGILVTTYYGSGTQATITGNTISSCTEGIAVGYDASDTSVVTAHSNNLTGNVTGINSTAPAVDAEDNWWGSASGPTQASNTFNVGSQGVAASDNVDFVPWLDAAPPGGASFAPVTTTDPVGSFSSIQAGIDFSNPGGTVNAVDGTYTATSLTSIVITKDGLSLVGESRDGTIIDAGPWGTSSAGWPRGIQVYANDVTISDLTVQGFTGDMVNTGGYGIVFRDWAHDTPAEGYIFYSGGIVDNVKLDNNYSSLYALVHRNLTVSNSLIQNSSADGMFIARESDDATITGNTVLNSANHGIWVGYCWMALGPSDNAIITGNVVDGAVEGGISFVGSSGAVISGNDISHVKGEEPEGAFGGWSRGAISLKDGVSNVTVSNNVVHDNDGLGTGSGRGIGVDGTSSNITIVGNVIRNNAGGGIKVMGTTSGWTANSNSIYSNTGYGAQNATSAVLDFSGNWWGTNTPAGVAGQVSANVDYTPWLDNGTDKEPGTPGFQGDFSTLDVDDDSPQTGATGRIQEAVNLVSGSTVNVAAGTYAETTNVDGRSDISIVGADRDTVILRPTSTLCWDVGGYGCGRHAAVRVVASTDINFSNMTFDFDLVKGNNVAGVFYWDSTGTLNHNVLKNMGAPDASGFYAELTSYIRAPSYSDGTRAAVTFSDNIFTDTGRLGIVTHDFVQATIEGNTFTKTTDDFGYAIEMGSRSTGTISDNIISGYDTPAASDGSASAGIYIENSFTAGLPHVNKPVTVTANTLTGNQYGLWIGNEYDGYAGDIDVIVTLSGNSIQDNTDGGIYVVDEDRAAGSSVTLTASGNTVADNGHAGYYFNTYGDGELHADVSNETISGHENGVLVEDNASGASGSLYDLSIGPDNDISGNDTGVFLAGVSGVVISGNEIHHNLNRSGYAGAGILLWGDNDNNQILNNKVHDNDRQGIFVGHDTLISTGNTISGNVIYDNGLNTNPNPPDASAYGLQLWNADNNTISNNEIYGHDDWFAYPGFDFAQGIYLFDSNHNLLSGNYLHDNNYGVGLWGPDRGDGSNLINFNSILGNTGYGVRNFDALTVNAENNWWGACSGPYHPTLNPLGTGNAAGDNVDFTPWITCDTDGDGCTAVQEAAMTSFDDAKWYDFFDVPAPANPDMTANGPRSKAVTMADVLAVLFYVGTRDGDGGVPNANGVAYDSVKGSCDWNADTTPDKEGLCYDRSPSTVPNPPWEAGPPNGAVSIADVLTALAQVGLSCSG
jgi:parallel beta-helix repeat protein